MSITLCTVSGTVQSLLGAGVTGCAITASVPSPFWHDSGIWISGEIASTMSASDGTFSLAVIETASCNQTVNFTFSYFDGIAGKRNRTYTVVVPNQASATLFSLIGTTSGSPITPLGVQYGGIGVNTLTQYAVLLGNGVSGITSTSPGTAGYPLCSNGASANPSFQALPIASLSGYLPAANFPALTGAVTTPGGSYVTSLVATTNATLTTLSGLTTASALASIGTISTGVWHGTAVGAQYGGTGINTSASTGVPAISAGTWSTSTYLAAANFPALTGDVTTSAGAYGTTLAATTNATLTTLSALTTASSLSSIGTIATGVWHGTAVGAQYGGTGINTSAATGVPIVSSGTWTTPTLLPVAQGGTNLASGTSGGILGYTGTGTLASSGALTASQLIIGGGAGATPSTLAAGSQFQPLVMGASNPGYAALALNQSAAVSGTLPAGNGGTGVTSVTTAPAATAFAGWDANKNLSANNHIEGYRTQATANSTLAIVVGDAYQQTFTGTTSGQIVTLPVTSTLVAGMAYLISNTSNQTVTVQSSGGNSIEAMAANTQLAVTCISTSGTGTASWQWAYQQIQNSLSGGGTVTSVTFTGDGTVLSSTPSTAVTTTGTLTGTLNTQTANKILAGPTSGSAATPTFRSATSADLAATTATAPYGLVNLGLKTSVSASALTVTLTQKDGSSAPTADNPTLIDMPTNAATAGTYNIRSLTATLAQTISSGTTLGMVASPTQPMYVYAIDSDGAGTMKLGVATTKYDETQLQSTVAESFSATATNASPCVFTANGHGMSNGYVVTLTGTPPTGFSTATNYYVVSKAANTFQLSATSGGSAINSSSTGSSIVIHIGDGHLVSAAVYTGVSIRLIGQVYDASLATPGTWVATSQVQLPVLSPRYAPPTVSRLTGGATGTYYTPPGVVSLEVHLQGGGGGGSGSGTAGAGGAATDGADSTFGSNLTAAKGIKGTLTGANAGTAGTGGAVTISEGIDMGSTAGGNGVGHIYVNSVTQTASGGVGGSSFYGGNGGSNASAAGTNATTSSGSGGGGAGIAAAAGATTGTGGGAGGHVWVLLTNPAASYVYSVGAGGSGGSAGSSGNAGGNGGGGVLIIRENYQ